MKGEEVIRSVFFKVVGAMNVIDYVFHYHPSAQIEPCSWECMGNASIACALLCPDACSQSATLPSQQLIMGSFCVCVWGGCRWLFSMTEICSVNVSKTLLALLVSLLVLGRGQSLLWVLGSVSYIVKGRNFSIWNCSSLRHRSTGLEDKQFSSFSRPQEV